MKRKIITLCMVLVLTLTVFTGCVTPTTSTNSSTSTTSTTAPTLKPDDLTKNLTISCFQVPTGDSTASPLYSSYNDNPVVTFLNDKFNMKLDFQQPPTGSETDQFNLMLGTGDYTDVISMLFTKQTDVELFNDGVIREISSYLETYMPNYYKYITDPANEDAYNILFDSTGKTYSIPAIAKEDGIAWGGLVYREDILTTVTAAMGTAIAFPSGNTEPTTVDDLEYMLTLMSGYFQASGLPDYAPLILPNNGILGPLCTGFGVLGPYIGLEIDGYVLDGDTVQYGPMEQGFYNYLVKMKDWYSKGFIYKDFASRNQDVFYLPNTALTYGGAAGIWYGLTSQLGDTMSLPDFGLKVVVKPMTPPIDTANGVTEAKASNYFVTERASVPTSFAITTKCSDENMIRFMTAMDYLFTEEGSNIKTFGLDAAHGSADNTIMVQAGLAQGSFTFDESGVLNLDPLMDSRSGQQLTYWQSLVGLRLPGMENTSDFNRTVSESFKSATATWQKYGKDNNLTYTLRRTAEENETYNTIMTSANDYVNSMVPQFIMGTKELTPETWDAFVDQLKLYDIETAISVTQAAYDRANAQ